MTEFCTISIPTNTPFSSLPASSPGVPRKSLLAGQLFPSCSKPLYQSEAKCEAIDIMLMIFYSHANKTSFHNIGFAVSLILKVRGFGTRKWPPLLKKASLSACCYLIFSIKFATFLENYFKNSSCQCYEVKLQIQILRDNQCPIVKIAVITLLNS